MSQNTSHVDDVDGDSASYVDIDMDDPSDTEQATGTPKKIVVFGSSQVGKSSLIALLTGTPMTTSPQPAKILIGGGAKGCTMESTSYTTADNKFVFFDTTGLNEGDAGTVPAKDAIKNLAAVLKSLKQGLHLLVWVTRKGAILQSDQVNYRLFVSSLAGNLVPCIGIVTGCELDVPIDKYESQLSVYHQAGINIKALYCGSTASEQQVSPTFWEKGLKNSVAQSKVTFLNAIETNASANPILLYEKGGFIGYFRQVWNSIIELMGLSRQAWISTKIKNSLKNLDFSDLEIITLGLGLQ